MAIVINGSGTVTGISVGGLPDDIIDSGTLADNAVGLAQMAGGTDGNIITYDTSGNPAVVATGSDGQVLTSAGADAVPVFEAVAAGDNTPSFSATHSNTALGSSGVWTLVPFSTEVMDNGDCYDNSAGEYKFTPGVAGYYQVSSVLNWYASSGNVTSPSIALYKNGSEYISFRSTGYTSNQAAYYVDSSTYSGILNLSDSDYLQVYWNVSYSSTAPSTNGLGAFSATRVII